MTFFDYMSQVEGDALSGVMRKLQLQTEDHPYTCPPDCAFGASLERLKKKHPAEVSPEQP
jgi:hypothetical protein